MLPVFGQHFRSQTTLWVQKRTIRVSSPTTHARWASRNFVPFSGLASKFKYKCSYGCRQVPWRFLAIGGTQCPFAGRHKPLIFKMLRPEFLAIKGYSPEKGPFFIIVR